MAIKVSLRASAMGSRILLGECIIRSMGNRRLYWHIGNSKKEIHVLDRSVELLENQI